MPVHLLGINHRTAPVEVRESVVFDPESLSRALPEIVRLPSVSEAVIVSTCNRTEIYAQLATDDSKPLTDWLVAWHSLGDEIRDCFYSLEDAQCARHLFAVACGLDSVVLGEPQILGQIKDAYRSGEQAGSVGPRFSRLFQQAFAVAKQVRSETGIGASPVSVAYAAVLLARRLYGGLRQQTALLVGAGETVELAARHLQRQGIRHILIANRNLSRAAELAARFNGVAIGLDELPAHLHQADVLITATRSPAPLIHHEHVLAALKTRRRRPMCIVDIGVPRDVDPRVRELEDAYLFTVDDLHSVIEESWHSRREAAVQAEQVIDYAVEQYQRTLRTLQAVPTIRALREETERMRDAEVAHAQRLLAAGRPPEEVIQLLGHSLTRKFLHTPSTRLRAAGEQADEELLEAAAELFGLAGEDTAEADPPAENWPQSAREPNHE